MRNKLTPDDYFLFVIIFLFLVILIQLFSLQVIKGEDYRQIAQKNYFRMIRIPAKRGIIYDRNLKPFVENVPSMSLYLNIQKIEDKKRLAKNLSEIVDLNEDEILTIISNNRYRKYTPVLVKDKLGLAKAIEIQENIIKFPGVSIVPEAKRNYLNNNHFIGYVGKIREEEYSKLKDKGYRFDDDIGKSGLEKKYETYLKGSIGYKIVQVDAYGNNLGFVKGGQNRSPIPGKSIILTTDLSLQEKIAEIMPKDKNSAVVVMNPMTGGIIAYFSYPVCNLNKFVTGIPYKEWQEIIQDENKPLLDRVSNATYPPGSIFKLVVAAYCLENDLITPETVFYCSGGLQLGNRYFRCWQEGGHGRVNLLTSIEESCDIYYYNLAKLINLDDFHNFVQKCGFIKRCGIDLIERKGFFPTRHWYNKHYGKYGWGQGHILNLSIGQGEVLVTPLQLACFFSALVNGGFLVRPHFVDYILSEKSPEYQNLIKEKFYYDTTEITKLPISEKTLSLLKEGLNRAVNGKRATGSLAKLDSIIVGGKTGSAENPDGLTHSWFVCVAPLYNPEITVVIFVENAGHGGAVAAPLAKEIMQFYFSRRKLDIGLY